MSLTSFKSAATAVGVGVLGALGGLAVGNILAVNVTPKLFAPNATDSQSTAALKQLVVPALAAVAIAVYGRKYVPPVVAYGAAIGLLILPVRNAIYAMAPAGSPMTFLGGGPMAMPMFARAGRVTSAYPQLRAGMSSYPQARTPLGSYPQVSSYPTAAYQHQPA